MRKARIAVAFLFLVSLFCTIDLGMNFIYNFVSEYLDGLTSHSILHGFFGILGDNSWSLGMFFELFERSAWISFLLLIVNTILYFFKGTD